MLEWHQFPAFAACGSLEPSQTRWAYLERFEEAGAALSALERTNGCRIGRLHVLHLFPPCRTCLLKLLVSCTGGSVVLKESPLIRWTNDLLSVPCDDTTLLHACSNNWSPTHACAMPLNRHDRRSPPPRCIETGDTSRFSGALATPSSCMLECPGPRRPGFHSLMRPDTRLTRVYKACHPLDTGDRELTTTNSIVAF